MNYLEMEDGRKKNISWAPSTDVPNTERKFLTEASTVWLWALISKYSVFTRDSVMIGSISFLLYAISSLKTETMPLHVEQCL